MKEQQQSRSNLIVKDEEQYLELKAASIKKIKRLSSKK